MSNPRPPASRTARLLGWLLRIALVGVLVWALYPGWYSYDSAAQLVQARTGETMNLQPPLVPVVWSALLALGAPPGAMFLFNLALLVVGLELVADVLRRQVGGSVSMMLLVLLVPPITVLVAHVWSDVTLAGALMLTIGLAAQADARGSRACAVAALVAMLFAAGVRHNAIFALPPIAGWLAHVFVGGARETRPTTARLQRAPVVLAPATAAPSRRRVALVGVGLLVAAIATAVVLDRALTVRRVVSWTPTAAWDLAAVSIATDTMRIPERMHGPTLTVDDLRATVDADTALHLLLSERTPIDAGILAPLPPDVMSTLRWRWLSLPFTEPRAYFAHRLRVAWSLFGPQRADKAPELHVTPGVVAIAGNPAIARNATGPNAMLARLALAERFRWVFAALPYCLLAVVALALVPLARPSPARAAAIVVALSGIGYALALIPLVPAAEVRYALWPMLAGLVASALAWHLARHDRRATAATTARATRPPPPFTAGDGI